MAGKQYDHLQATEQDVRNHPASNLPDFRKGSWEYSQPADMRGPLDANQPVKKRIEPPFGMENPDRWTPKGDEIY